jgi:CBS domain-containing protein
MGEKVDIERAFTKRISDALKLTHQVDIGVLSAGFLSQSVGILDPREPITISPDSSIKEAVSILARNTIGCLLVVSSGKIEGIFTERDYITKLPFEAKEGAWLVSDFMTSSPVCGNLETTIAFAINLMSEGGFRHLPLVDKERRPVGIISVKDLIDFISRSLLEDLLDFPTLENKP